MAFVRSVIISLALAAVSYAALTKRVTCPGGHVTANRACCAMFPVVQNLQENLFDGSECREEAHSALRLAFHDAIGFSLNSNQGGVADGSILLFNTTELQFHANAGIDDITARQFPVFQTIGLRPVGTANCPGAPRLQFMFGRPPPIAPSSDHTVPEPSDDVDTILARFADAGFDASEVDVIDVTIPGTPFDSTVGAFDTQVFLEVLLTSEVLSPIAGEMRLQSDFVVSHDSRTACLWQAMINNQQLMVTSFAAAMAKLQVLGQDVNKMVDCSDVIQQPALFAGLIKFPASFSMANVEQACASTFPQLQNAGPAPTVAPVLGS
ncbi:MnP-atypical-a, class II peroxidase [Cyathus striatus]|nr:MnP-atypical-a, class II peroxidase [Cyathus striatus]